MHLDDGVIVCNRMDAGVGGGGGYGKRRAANDMRGSRVDAKQQVAVSQAC